MGVSPLATNYSNTTRAGFSPDRAAVDNELSLEIKYPADTFELDFKANLAFTYRNSFPGFILVNPQFPVLASIKTNDQYFGLQLNLDQAAFSYYFDSWSLKLGCFSVKEGIAKFSLGVPAFGDVKDSSNPFVPPKEKSVFAVKLELPLWDDQFFLKGYFVPLPAQNTFFIDSTVLEKVFNLPVAADLIDFKVPGSFEFKPSVAFMAQARLWDKATVFASYDYSTWPNPAPKRFGLSSNPKFLYQAEFYYPKKHQVTLSASGAVWWLLLWGQFYFSSTDSAPTTVDFGQGQKQIIPGEYGQTGYVLGAQFHKPGTDFNVLAQQAYVPLLLSGDKPQHITSLRGEAAFWHEFLKLGLELTFLPEYNEASLSFGLSYQPLSWLTLEAGYNYMGESIPSAGNEQMWYLQIKLGGN